MTNVDVQFIEDLNQCLQLADQLADVNTEEAQLFVSQQLQDLHKFLQTKQRDAETRVEEEIKKEEIEIDNLKQRIDRATKSDGTNERDIAFTDFGLLWTVLKDEYWPLAFNAYISETRHDVKVILENLIAILKVSFQHCKSRAAESREKMVKQVYFPGEDLEKNRNLKPPPNPDSGLENLIKGCQIKSTPFCLPSIQQAVINDVKKDKAIAGHFKHQSEEILYKALEKYLVKCVEFSWIACFEEPEVRLITTPTKECKGISSQFSDLQRTINHSRQDVACVEWPAIIQDGVIKFPWHLYSINQPRPQPRHMHGEASKDYRATGTEDKDGRFVRDNEEDDATQAKVQPAAVGSEHSVSQSRDENNASGNHGKLTDVNEKEKKAKDNAAAAKAVGVNSRDKNKTTESGHSKPTQYTTKSKGKGKAGLNF